MAVLGDRASAALLSALAEAPDFQGAAAFLVAQILDVTESSRACMLRLDEWQEHIAGVAAAGFDSEMAGVAIPIGDLANPLVVATLALTPISGRGSIGPRALGDL